MPHFSASGPDFDDLQDMVESAVAGGPSPPPPVVAVDDAVTIEAMISTLVDVLANDTHTNAIVSLGTVPTGVSAVVEGNKIRVKMPYASSGLTTEIPYTLTQGANTANATLRVTVPNVVLAKPQLYLGQTYNLGDIDDAIANGWLYGMHSWTWDDHGSQWIQKCKDLGRKCHITFVCWQHNSGPTSGDHLSIPVSQGGNGVGFTTRGQTAFNVLANNTALHDTIGVITCEFESSNSQKNIGDVGYISGTEEHVIGTYDFMKSQLASIGLDGKLWSYRISHPTTQKLTPRWSRLYYGFAYEGAGTDVRFAWDNSHTALRTLSGNNGLPNMQSVGSYIQAHIRHPITPRVAWPSTLKYVRLGYGHHLRQLYTAERAGCDWLTYFASKIDLQTFYTVEGWTALKRAVADFQKDDISINSDFANSAVAIGAL